MSRCQVSRDAHKAHAKRLADEREEVAKTTENGRITERDAEGKRSREVEIRKTKCV